MTEIPLKLWGASVTPIKFPDVGRWRGLPTSFLKIAFILCLCHGIQVEAKGLVRVCSRLPAGVY